MHAFTAAISQLTASAMANPIPVFLFVGLWAAIAAVVAYVVIREVRSAQSRKTMRELDERTSAEEVAEVTRGRLAAVRAESAARTRATAQPSTDITVWNGVSTH